MNIFIDGSVIDGEYQGSRTFVLELISHLSSTFKDVNIYIGTKNTNKAIPNLSNINIVELNCRSRLHKYCFVLPKIIVKCSCDIVITQYFTPLYVPKKTRIFNVVHDVLIFDYPSFFPSSKLKRIIQRISIKKSDKIITVSDYSKNRITTRFNFDSENILVVNNGIRDIFQEKRPDSEPNLDTAKFGIIGDYFICVSRIEPRKNIEALIRLAGIFLDKTIVLIGSNTFADDYYSKLISECKNFVHLTGVSDLDMIGLVSASELFIYPSFAEGFGIPPVEAAALGVPVVCSNATALSELSLNHECFFDPSDEIDLLRAVSYALKQSDEELQELRDRIISDYNWDRSFAVLDDTIRDLNE